MIKQILSTLIIGTTMLGTTTAMAQEACDFGTPVPAVVEQMSEWSFLIGNHTIDFILWQDGAWSEPVAQAQWNGWWGLGGNAIIDEWFGPQHPGRAPVYGVNVRVFDDAVGRWRMTWQQTRDAVAAIYESEMRDDGFMHMWQTNPPEEQETDAWFEITGADTWIRIQRVRGEDGVWVNQFRLDATRQSCN